MTSRRVVLLVGSLGLLFLLVALGWKLVGRSSANVPLGIAGARLGDDVETLKHAVPGLDERGPERLTGRALVFDEPATCTYQLAVRRRLSKIDCEIDPSPGTEAKLLAVLRKLYGVESEQRGGSWEWSNARARLRMVVSSGPSAIRISNWSAEHERQGSSTGMLFL